MSKKKYNMSFTTGGLFYNESLTVVELYLSLMDWKKVRGRMLSDNLLQTRTKSSAIRISREICLRLETLTHKQLQLLESGSAQEQRYLLWIAVCKRYAFIRQFMDEMVREKYIRMDLQISPADYDIFFQEKAEIHIEFDRLSASTRAKQRQVLFKSMREAEILSRNNMILPGLPTRELVEALADDNPGLLAMLPISDMDIKEWLQ
ncbi:MAG: DUF1819 family protein [Deltaproteobacteria bacterium]|nr:DUF1819 family protein [Deltaproteobacteria bacterium]MBL7216981.1 DUF1819 family protein [Desulfobacteraceae bacterium]